MANRNQKVWTLEALNQARQTNGETTYDDRSSFGKIRFHLSVDRGNCVPLSSYEMATLIDLLKGVAELNFLRAKGLHLKLGELSDNDLSHLSSNLSKDQFQTFMTSYNQALNSTKQATYPPSVFLQEQQATQNAYNDQQAYQQAHPTINPK